MENKVKLGKISNIDITWTPLNTYNEYLADFGLFEKYWHDVDSSYLKPKERKIPFMETTLYKWLNTEFKDNLNLTQAEKTNIREVRLLTVSEANKYFSNDEERTLSSITGEKDIIWWLINSSDRPQDLLKVPHVFRGGHIDEDADSHSNSVWVRPLITTYDVIRN